MIVSKQRPAPDRGWGFIPRPGGRSGAGRDASATARGMTLELIQ